MADEIEGGCYLNPDGVTYHDAHGKPVPAPKTAPVKIPADAVGEVTVETIETVDTGKTDAKTVTAKSPQGYGGAPSAKPDKGKPGKP